LFGLSICQLLLQPRMLAPGEAKGHEWLSVEAEPIEVKRAGFGECY